MDLNSVLFGGRLGSEPKFVQVGTATKLELWVASNKKWTGKDGTRKEKVCWANVERWVSSDAEKAVLAHLKKGSRVVVQGELEYETWDSKDGGGKKSRVVVRADAVTVVDLPARQETPAPTTQATPSAAGKTKDADFAEFQEYKRWKAAQTAVVVAPTEEVSVEETAPANEVEVPF